jgi:DNA polymerase elongation subunit (family B)
LYQNIYIDSPSGERPIIYVFDDKEGLLTLDWSQFDYAYVKDPTGRHLAMTGERVTKVKRFVRGAKNLFESDVYKETRVLTDLYPDDDAPSTGHSILFFDIEVSMETGLPDVHKAENEITAITVYEPVLQKYVAFVLDTECLHDNRTVDDTDIIFCVTETDLLHKFMNVYEEIAPTIITGWNSNGFDIPYVYNRLRRMCGKSIANRLSPIGKVKYSDRMERYKIAGVSCLDYLELYKNFTYTEQPNYRLNTIGLAEVNMGKIEYEGSLDTLFRNDIETFIRYNVQDVRIIVELDKKMKLIDVARGVCHLGHIPYEEFGKSSRFLEGAILTYLHRKGLVATDKGDAEYSSDDGVGFEGAYVKDPKPGLYDWVYSLDLQSLYPSVIMSLNISPETKVGFVRNYDVEQHIRKEIVAYVVEELGNSTTVEMSREDFVDFLRENDLTISSNGVLYTTVKRGIIPEILENWFAKRVEYKDLMKKYAQEGDEVQAAYYDQMQHIQKIFLNSLYGVLGFSGFRFYDVDNALATTAVGQDVIRASEKFINKQYQKLTGRQDDFVIYCDTDSAYVSVAPFMDASMGEKEFTINEARIMEAKLNGFYNQFALAAFNCDSHKFVIKGETIASTAFWVIKKRYVMDKVYDLEKNQDVQKMVVKGMDAVRSSFPKAFRAFMSDILKDILRKTDKAVLDKKILDFKEIIKTLPYEDVARNTSANNLDEYYIPGSLMQFKKGTPGHVKAAIVYNRLIDTFGLGNRYAKIRSGEKIKYVLLKKNPMRLETMAFTGDDDPMEIKEIVQQYIDTDELFEKEIRNKLADFYSALGWGPISTEVNQNAETFFSF